MCAAAFKLSKMSLLSFGPNSFHIKKKALPASHAQLDVWKETFPGWSLQHFKTGDSHETVNSIIPVREHTHTRKKNPFECTFDISVPRPQTHIRCNDSIKSVTTTLLPINDETSLHLPRWKQPDSREDQQCLKHAVNKKKKKKKNETVMVLQNKVAWWFWVFESGRNVTISCCYGFIAALYWKHTLLLWKWLLERRTRSPVITQEEIISRLILEW